MHSPEHSRVENSENGRGWKQANRIVWATTLAAIAIFAPRPDHQTGEISSFPAKIKANVPIDNKHTVVSWNLHNQAAEHKDDIRLINKRHDVDAFLFQELNRNDAKYLSHVFSSWNIEFDMADRQEKSDQGGFGNAIMTKQPQTDVTSVVLNGLSSRDNLISSIESGGISTDSIKSHEFRSGIASTIELATSSGLEDVDLVSGHLSPYSSVREGQFNDFKQFIDSQNDQDTPIFIGGDFNATPKEMFEYQRDGYIIPETGPTFTDNESRLDYIVYDPADVVGIDRTRVLYNFRSDHYPVKSTWIAEQD